MKRVLILGSTGSIGTQALEVVERSEELEVVGLAAQTPLGGAWSSRRAATASTGSRSPTRTPRAARREAWTEGEVLAGAEGLVG